MLLTPKETGYGSPGVLRADADQQARLSATFGEAPGKLASPVCKQPALKPMPPLRVGLFAASRMQSRALVESFAAMAHGQFANIVLVAVNEDVASGVPALWRAYRWLDGWAAGRCAVAAEAVDLFLHFACVRISMIPARSAETAAVDAWRADMRKLGLDVAFALGNVDDGMIAGIATYGVWRLDFGGRQTGLEGFRDVVEGQTLSTLNLRARVSNEREKLLYQSCTRTAPFSATRNQDKLLRRAAQLPGRALREVHRSRGEALAAARAWVPRPAMHEPPTESNFGALQGLARTGLNLARRGLEKLLYVDQWFIAYRFACRQQRGYGIGRFVCLAPPAGRFWADPFPLMHDGRHYIFFAERVLAEGKGHIAVIEIDRDGHCSEPRRVLERPEPLAYPFLIETDGQLYMVPDTGLRGSVELYRCERFPYRWRLAKVLLRADCCADATLYRAGGNWWMFLAIGTDESDVHDELFLYHADRLDGDWLPCPGNPVKSDARNASPAGQLYVQDGQLYRPARIGVPSLDSGIAINRILKLAPDDYREQEVVRIVPLPGGVLRGLHTFNRAGDLSVIDGYTRHFRPGSKAVEYVDPILVRGRDTVDVRP